MRRTAKKSRSEQIELSEEKTKLRTVLLVVMIAAAVASFGYGINTLLSADPGLQEITVLETNELSSGGDFTFYYNIGAGETPATTEYKAVRALYSQAAKDSYRLFSADGEFEDCKNLWYLNHHLNEKIEVDPALYEAFTLLEESGTRYHYLAPMYEMYLSLFQCQYDYETVDYDPYLNDDLRAFYAKTVVFTNDSNAVKLELLGNSTVRLSVSDAYLSFAEENGITRFIDLFWLKNAFAADYIADLLEKNGYTSGTLISYDGFVRSLGDTTGTEYSLDFSHRDGVEISTLETLRFSGAARIVYLRDYPAENSGGGSYYVRENGEIRSPYVDPADGLCKSSLPELAAVSATLSCTELALKIAPIYISDAFDEAALQALGSEGISAYYCVDHALRCAGTE